MSFTSIPFIVFFFIFFLLYWVLFSKKVKLQNYFLLIGSYFFYAWADWRFLGLLICISALNFFLGIYIEKEKSLKTKKALLYIGLLQGIGGLFLFKYFNFFIQSFNDILNRLHLGISLQTLNILIPLGISFFTFKTISYLIDVSNEKISATKDWVVFFIYISFFPTIISGPIDKAKTLVPQLLINRKFNYEQAVEGMRQILWGLFKKSVIADNCATVTNPIFTDYKDLPASSLLVGVILYCFQIYADFSGYSDMAIGISRLLGFNITRNFEYPFFAQNIAEFWRKWHISLTSWLTEYVFTPLSISFRNLGSNGLILAIVINFTIIGMWHGANWTYLLFGFLHGCYYIPLILSGAMNKKKKIAKNSIFPSFKETINVVLTFFLVAFTFVIFKSNNISSAIEFYKGLFSISLFVRPPSDLHTVILCVFFILIMLVSEWFGRDKDFAMSKLSLSWPKFLRWSMYILVFISILVFKASEQQFIYLKF